MTVARFQTNHPALGVNSPSFDCAGVIDDAALQGVGRLRRKNNKPAGRLHRVAVFDQRLNGCRGHNDVGECVVTIELQAIAFARRQCHRAHLRDDYAIVSDLRCEQGNVTAERGGEVAVIGNAAGCAVAGEIVISRHEITGGKGVGGGDQTADFYARTRREIHAVWIGEEDLAGGGDASEYLAGIAVQHRV